LALELRNMVRPFNSSGGLLKTAVPMRELVDELAGQLKELAELKRQLGMS
jgi:hypothetical protein